MALVYYNNCYSIQYVLKQPRRHVSLNTSPVCSWVPTSITLHPAAHDAPLDNDTLALAPRSTGPTAPPHDGLASSAHYASTSVVWKRCGTPPHLGRPHALWASALISQGCHPGWSIDARERKTGTPQAFTVASSASDGASKAHQYPSARKRQRTEVPISPFCRPTSLQRQHLYRPSQTFVYTKPCLGRPMRIITGAFRKLLTTSRTQAFQLRVT